MGKFKAHNFCDTMVLTIIQYTFLLKVQILLTSSFAKLMSIQFHDRGNAEILTSPDNNNFLSLVFPIVGR